MTERRDAIGPLEKSLGLMHERAQYTEDVVLARAVNDTREALAYDGELLSTNQLARLLGVKRGRFGKIKIIPFFNACMNVHQIEAIQALPHDKRIQAVATAGVALDNMLSSRGR